MNHYIRSIFLLFLLLSFFLPAWGQLDSNGNKNSIAYTLDPEVASRTYAVILNGGTSPTMNMVLFYNSCRFMFCTLKHSYGIPQDNIYVIMSDGTDPGKDQNFYGELGSSETDLDDDGQPDIEYSATRENLSKVFGDIRGRVNEGDHLFLFVSNHGDGDSEMSRTTYLHLWDGAILYDYELAELLSPILDKGANVSVLLGPCRSGGFVDDLKKIGCTVMTSCEYWEYVEIEEVNPEYDAFLYHWTCAVRGTDEKGTLIYPDADRDGDGSVTMKEAFDYTRAKLVRKKEHMCYQATPSGCGDVSFNRIPTGPDIYIRDNMSDTGYEPNSTTDIGWDSPDIWVRNHPDGHTYHQNPYLTPDHTTASVYVRVHNRSPRAYPSSGSEYLHCYWTRASTSATPADWKGDGEDAGGTVGSAPIPALAPGDSAVIRLDWTLPATLSGNMSASGSPRHLSLQAEITSDPKPGPKGGKGNDTFTDPLSSRRIARKTLSVIDSRDISRGASVMVRDVSSGPYGLEVRERPQTWNKGIHSKAEVILSIPADGNTARIPSFGGADPTVTLGFLATPPGLVTVTLRPKGLLVTDSYWKDCPYTFDLIQHDSTGKIVGGAAFTIDYEMTATLPIDSLVVGRSVTLTADIPEDTTDDTTAGSPFTYWLDKDGNTVGTGGSVTVRPTRVSDRFTAVSVTAEGSARSGSVNLSPRAGIREVRKDATGRPETVELLGAEDSDDSRIRILSLTHPETAPTDTMVPRGATSVSVDAGKLPAGICSVAYISGGRAVDELRISVK